jgi:1-deoxy-D-xylulose-5-phosphate synthase
MDERRDLQKRGLLAKIGSPADLKKLPPECLPRVAQEIREKIIATVSKTGGHLAPSLGVVELTIALHYML